MLLEVPPWSPRFVLAHANSLPMESAFVAEVRGGQQFRGWNQDRYMQAALIDSIRSHTHMFILANKDPKKKSPDSPEPWPLPDKQAKQRRQDKPGSFAHIVRSRIAAVKKLKGGV